MYSRIRIKAFVVCIWFKSPNFWNLLWFTFIFIYFWMCRWCAMQSKRLELMKMHSLVWLWAGLRRTWSWSQRFTTRETVFFLSMLWPRKLQGTTRSSFSLCWGKRNRYFSEGICDYEFRTPSYACGLMVLSVVLFLWVCFQFFLIFPSIYVLFYTVVWLL